MACVFLGVENPLSMLGDKSANVPKSNSASRPQGKKAKEAYDKDMDARKRKWSERQGLLDKKEVSIGTDTSRSNDLAIAHKFRQDHSHVRLGVAGSVVSMFKRLGNYSSEENIKFDTLVFMGHGRPGVMSVGMGSITFPVPSDNENKKTTAARELLVPEKTGDRILQRRSMEIIFCRYPTVPCTK